MLIEKRCCLGRIDVVVEGLEGRDTDWPQASEEAARSNSQNSDECLFLVGGKGRAAGGEGRASRAVMRMERADRRRKVKLVSLLSLYLPTRRF